MQVDNDYNRLKVIKNMNNQPPIVKHLCTNHQINNATIIPVPIKIVIEYGLQDQVYEIYHPWVMKMHHSNNKQFWYFINKDLYHLSKNTHIS